MVRTPRQSYGRRKGISLTYKLLVFVLIVGLAPSLLVSYSSLNTYNAVNDAVGESIEDIKQISVEESRATKEAAISRAKQTMLQAVQNNLRTTRDDKVDKYSEILTSIEKQADIVAGYTETNWEAYDANTRSQAFNGMVWAGPYDNASNPEQHPEQLKRLSHAGVLLEEMDQGEPLTSLTYFGTADNNLVTSQNLTEAFRSFPQGFSPVERPWYVRAAEENRTVWTNTYVDANTKNLVTTVASPVQRNGELLGVVGFDVTLGVLSTDILETDPGFAFLLDSDGEAIVFPGMRASNKTVFAERTFRGHNLLSDNVSSDVRSLAENMVNGEEGVREVTIEGERSFVAYGPLETNDWSVGVAIPVTQNVEPINQIETDLSSRMDDMASSIETKTDTVKADVNNRVETARRQYVLLLTFLLLVILGSGMYFSHRITGPIIELQEKAESISKGGIGKEVDVNTGDEIEQLADSFNRVIRTIKILQRRDAPQTKAEPADA